MPCNRIFSTIATQPVTPTQLAVDGAEASAQKSDEFADGLFGFQETVSLESFFSAEVLVHRELELGGLSGHDALAASATNHRDHLCCTSCLNPPPAKSENYRF
jgi:hypothetical protein